MQAKQTVYTNVGAGIRSTAPQAEASVNSGATGVQTHTHTHTHTHRPRSANTKVWTSVGLYRPGGGSFTFFLEDMMLEGVLRESNISRSRVSWHTQKILENGEMQSMSYTWQPPGQAGAEPRQVRG